MHNAMKTYWVGWGGGVAVGVRSLWYHVDILYAHELMKTYL
jgi:hypothetical protein